LSGIGLYQNAKLGPKENFVISLPCEKQHMVIVCQATFCRPLADGIFCLGAAFASLADSVRADEFRSLVAASTKAAA
jgi:hypothetical protein